MVTQESTFSISNPPVNRPLLEYDAECFLCRNLAAFVSQRLALDIRPQSRSAIDISIQIQDRTLTGQEAWAWLIEQDPSFKQISWMATKLGWQSDDVASFFQSTLHRAKRWCSWCPRW